jgi:hypothetical protein
MTLHQPPRVKQTSTKRLTPHSANNRRRPACHRMRLNSFRINTKLARCMWGNISSFAVSVLKKLTETYDLSVAAGDLQLLEGRWYITHAGLLRIAERDGCAGIQTRFERTLSDPASGRWVFKSTVYRRAGSRGFTGYGDADATNVSPLVRGAEMRVAETRAVNRALRKAYGIGLCSVEELGWFPKPAATSPSNQARPFSGDNNGHHNGQPRLRDQLCLLIRQYNLDPNLVKAYAAHFCGTETIKEASRDLVESFISHLAASAKEDRDGLICKLNSFAPSVEVQQ